MTDVMLQSYLRMATFFRRAWVSTLWILAILGLTFLYGTYSILVNLSMSDDEVPYLSSSLVLSTEIVKLVICLATIWPQRRVKTIPSVSYIDMFLFSIPALCYAVNNNLAFYMQSQMDPTTYMVLGNLKILTTAVLYKFIMQSHINRTQWFLLGCLTVSGIFTSITALDSQSLSLSETHVTLLGVSLLVCYCFISGFAGVYTEYKLKTKLEISVLHQNTFLYSFGVLLNFFAWIIQAFHAKNYHAFFLFFGFSWATWTLVITQATVGLGMGYILKYKGSIVRLFIITSAPIVTSILSYLVFDWHPHPLFMLASFAVILSMLLYHLEERQKSWVSSKSNC